jgi:hypothetical protein
VRHSAPVLSKASVVSSMTGFECLDGQQRNLLARSGDDDSVIRAQIVGFEAVKAVAELPPDVDGQISLRNRASHCH